MDLFNLVMVVVDWLSSLDWASWSGLQTLVRIWDLLDLTLGLVGMNSGRKLTFDPVMSVCGNVMFS